MYIPYEQKDIQKGILRLTAVEGYVEEFLFVDNETVIDSAKTRLKLRSSFPFQTGKILNLNDIENGIDILNSIPSQNVFMDIRPGSQDAQSKVVIINNAPNSYKNTIKLSYDNSNSKSLHENKVSLRYTRYDLTGMNDTFAISASTDTEFDAFSKYSRNILLSYQLPVGRLLFSETFSVGESRTSTMLVSGDHMRNGSRTVNSYTDLEYTLYRDQNHKIVPVLNYTFKENNDYMLIKDVKTKTEVTSRRLSSISAGLKYNYFGDGYMFYVKPSYVMGVNWFNSLDDKDYDYFQHAQYNVGKLAVFSNFTIKKMFTLNIFADSQYADKDLFSQDTFSIGGEGSIRGYKYNSLSGNTGYFVQNDISVPFYFYTEIPVLRNFSLSAFFDIGTVRQQDRKNGTLSGYGAKASFNNQYISAYYTYARKIESPKDFKHDDFVQYFGVDLKLNF